MKNKIMGILNTKCKKVVAIITAIVIVATSGFGVYALLQEKTKLVLQDKTFVVEYGQSISFDVDQYLDLSNLSEAEKEKVIKGTKVDSAAIVNESTKEYPAIGQYVITITYQKEKVNVKVFVNDTTAPIFNTCGSVQFIKGTDFDYAQYIKADDLQEVTYDFKKDAVKSDSAGDYKMQVIATDKSDNKTEKKISVKVLETIDSNTHDAASSVDAQGNVVVTVTEKQQIESPTAPALSAGTGNTAKPNANSGSSKPNTNGTSGSTSSSGSNTGGTTTPPIQPEAPHVHKSGAYDGKWFSSLDEADVWAKNYEGPDGSWAGKQWSSVRCECGLIGIRFFNISYWE